MITIYHPVDDMELLLIRMELEAMAIPYFVVGQHFGSLYPGMQIPWHNERSIRVSTSHLNEGMEVIQHVRSYYSPAFENLAIKSKLRIFCEALLLGWVIPAGNKRPPRSTLNPDISRARDESNQGNNETRL